MQEEESSRRVEMSYMRDQRCRIGSIVLETLLLLILWFPNSSCKSSGAGSEPVESIIPPVVGADIADEDPGTEGIQYTFFYIGSEFEIQLQLESSENVSETIRFKSSLPLPSYLALDESSGIITVTPDGSEYSDTIYFWSEGASSGEETSSNPLRIDFTSASS